MRRWETQCIGILACVYVMYVRMCVCYVCVHVCMCACVCVHVYVMYVTLCACVCVCSRVLHECMCVCIVCVPTFSKRQHSLSSQVLAVMLTKNMASSVARKVHE